jgi:hypothetical protein
VLAARHDGNRAWTIPDRRLALDWQLIHRLKVANATVSVEQLLCKKRMFATARLS